MDVFWRDNIESRNDREFFFPTRILTSTYNLSHNHAPTFMAENHKSKSIFVNQYWNLRLVGRRFYQIELSKSTAITLISTPMAVRLITPYHANYHYGILARSLCPAFCLGGRGSLWIEYRRCYVFVFREIILHDFRSLDTSSVLTSSVRFWWPWKISVV